MAPATLAERLDRNSTPEPNTGCILWTGRCNDKGYGEFGLGRSTNKAHRVAFFAEHGRWPSGLACHRCDNPACINVRHLFEGDARANAQDMVRKGRGKGWLLKGERSPFSKLTESTVKEIRSSKDSQAALARRYRVSQPTIFGVIHRKTWAHVP